ncbi:MAG: thrombospondin type 3 repeat-containing protein [Pseudomonadales bacterium]|nr:thrombospondin type 3 repeat-containing protein [Pseudomonadales bacterium]
MSFQAISRVFSLIAFGLLMSGCIESTFSISYPPSGGSYVGMYNEAAPAPLDGTTALNEKFIFKFDSAPSNDVLVTLNGHDISEYVVYTKIDASIEVARIKHFFRQGSNKFSIDPWGFGPSNTFILDSAGPEIIITSGVMTYADRVVQGYNERGTASGTADILEPDTVTIKGFLRDPSEVGTEVTVDLYLITGYQTNGQINRELHSTHVIPVLPNRSFTSGPIAIKGLIEEEIWFDNDGDYRTPYVKASNNQYYTGTDKTGLPDGLLGTESTKKISLLYRISSTDAHEYISSREYLADSEHAGILGVDNAVRVAIGGTVIESMRPLIAAGLADAMKLAPIHAKCLKVGNNSDPWARNDDEYWAPDPADPTGLNGGVIVGIDTSVPDAGAAEILEKNAVSLNPENCLYWDTDRVCGGVSGVYPGQNITQLDFDAQDLADSSADPKVMDGFVKDADGFDNAITDPFYVCADNPVLSDGSTISPMTIQDGSRAGGGPMYLPIVLLGLTMKMDAFLRETIMLNGSKEVSLGGKKYTEIGGITLENLHGTMLLNGFTILDNNTLNVNMEITHLATGAAMVMKSPFGGNILIDMGMYIGAVSVDANAIVSAKGKKVDVALDPDNTNIGMSGVRLTEIIIKMDTWFGVIEIPIDGSMLDGLMDPMMGLIGGMIPAMANPIIAANLQKIAIGGAVAGLQDGTEFEMIMNVAELGTAIAYSGGFDMVVGLESVVSVTSADPFVTQALGPIFKDDPINPAEVINGTENASNSNLSVAISSNLINQALAAAYGTGSTHITIHNGTTYFGADPLTPGDPASLPNPGKPYLEEAVVDVVDGMTKRNLYTRTLASVGDTRIRLWPDMPPRLDFSEVVGSGGAGLAQVRYESATAYYDKLVDEDGVPTWKKVLSMKVDFDLGVTIDEKDGSFTMASGGPPSLNINSMQNYTNIQIPPSIVQIAIDMVLGAGGDFLSDKFLVLDLNEIAGAALNKEGGGAEFKYRSTTNLYTIDESFENACIEYVVDPVTGKDTLVVKDLRTGPNGETIVTLGADPTGLTDLVCKKLSFDVGTQNVGTIGRDGSNLFFQMSVIDANFPTLVGLPSFDLDGDQPDGESDSRDNCSVSRFELSKAVDNIGKGNLVDADGVWVPTAEDQIKAEINAMLASYHGTAQPTADDITNWNKLRVGDADVTGSPDWITLLYSNQSQYDYDGDGIGEMCEDDRDFDGIYADNLPQPVDNCPSVYNPNQENDKLPLDIGDACNVRHSFVMIRNLKTVVDGNPQCLVNTYGGTGWISNAVTATANCDPTNANQHFYLKSVNGLDGNNGFMFYTDEARKGNRLAAYGYVTLDGSGCTPDQHTGTSHPGSIRLTNANNAFIEGQNGELPGGCWTTDSEDRLDPIWWLGQTILSGASGDEFENPWFIMNKFEFSFSYPANNVHKFDKDQACLNYGSQTDVFSQINEGAACPEANNVRWGIVLGEDMTPWIGAW